MRIILLFLFFIPAVALSQEAPEHLYKPFVKSTLKHLEKMTKVGEKGDTAAMAELGYFYSAGTIPHSAVENWLYNPGKGAAWLHKGIAAGHTQTCAFLMGRLFQLREYSNVDSAFYYYQLAADKGSVPAMLATAYMYDPRDVHAMYWFSLAAKGGSAEASQWVSDINTAADSCFYRAFAASERDDMAEAIRLWHIDAKVNKTKETYYNLGRVYEKGYGVKADRQDATSWYDRACEAGYAPACYKSGKLDQSAGYGSSAYKSFQKALKLGYKDAQKDIDAMERQGAINEAERKAFMDAYIKKLNDQANNPTPSPVYTNPSTQANTYYYKVPGQTAAQRDQDMYDKMHKEQAQREKTYRDKWGN